MLESIFTTLGSLFASGPGLLLLAALAALIPLLWNWRAALGALVALHVATTLLLAYLHGTPILLTLSQLVAILVAGSVLTLAQWTRRAELPARQPTGWLVRLLAISFVVLAWWFIDPGIGLPMMSQPEVDLLVWIALCALFVTTLTADPFFAAVALLLWLLPAYAISTVLLPTSGMPALLGIAEVLVGLAGGYLILAQPRQQAASGARRIVAPLPQVQTVRTQRWPALRPPRPVVSPAAPSAAPGSPVRLGPPVTPLAENADPSAAAARPSVLPPAATANAARTSVEQATP
jgi:hypothetical protein